MLELIGLVYLIGVAASFLLALFVLNPLLYIYSKYPVHFIDAIGGTIWISILSWIGFIMGLFLAIAIWEERE